MTRTAVICDGGNENKKNQEKQYKENPKPEWNKQRYKSWFGRHFIGGVFFGHRLRKPWSCFAINYFYYALIRRLHNNPPEIGTQAIRQLKNIKRTYAYALTHRIEHNESLKKCAQHGNNDTMYSQKTKTTKHVTKYFAAAVNTDGKKGVWKQECRTVAQHTNEVRDLIIRYVP